jgi:protease I
LTGEDGGKTRWRCALKISGKKIPILATNGFGQSELEIPRDTLTEAGVEIHVASPENGAIKGGKKDWAGR